MGIKGLLPFVAKACRPGNISEFKGMRVAIDVSCFLHRGVFGCVEEIAHGINTDFCIRYVEKYLGVFLYYKCQVTLVFDGVPIDAKKHVNKERRESRENNQRRGSKLMDAGRNEEAYEVLRKGIGVPKEIIDAAVEYFNALPGVDVIVAPHEADAQLAFLSQNELVDLVVTQDSDLIVYGCETIALKLEPSGSCTIFEAAKLPKCFQAPLCHNFKFETFRRMCILAGCDYLAGGLPGIGLKKAEHYFARTTVTDPRQFLPRIAGFFNLRGVKVTEKFIEAFIRAEKTFLHQIIFDPVAQTRVPLTPYPGSDKNILMWTPKFEKYAHKYRFAGRL